MMKPSSDERLPLAVNAAIARVGSGAELARKCGVTRFAVQQWKKAGVSPQYVGKVASVTGLAPGDIRPDLFPPPVETNIAKAVA